MVGLVAEKRIATSLGGLVSVGNGTAAGARWAVDEVVREGATALVSFGFAGGLAPDVAAGSILVPRSVLTTMGCVDCDETLVRRLGGPLEGLLLGSDAVVTSVAEKARLFAETGAAAVDLESGAVAMYASAHDIPFAALRVVCDPFDRTLPLAALAALDSRGRIRFAAVLAALARRPDDILPLVRLATDAYIARRTLARHVNQLRLRH